MPEYLAPGVYVEEVSFRSKSIEGVSTTTTGFIGPTGFGPLDLEPDIVTSLGEFELIYGNGAQLDFKTNGGVLHNYMWHAVRAFFAEGGKRLYISRVFLANSATDDGRAGVKFTTAPAELADQTEASVTASADVVTAATDSVTASASVVTAANAAAAADPPKAAAKAKALERGNRVRTWGRLGYRRNKAIRRRSRFNLLPSIRLGAARAAQKNRTAHPVRNAPLSSPQLLRRALASYASPQLVVVQLTEHLSSVGSPMRKRPIGARAASAGSSVMAYRRTPRGRKSAELGAW